VSPCQLDLTGSGTHPASYTNAIREAFLRGGGGCERPKRKANHTLLPSNANVEVHLA
jgi:hypothetical protein